MKFIEYQKVSLIVMISAVISISAYAQTRPTIPNQSGVAVPVNPALRSPPASTNANQNQIAPQGNVQIDTSRSNSGQPTSTVIDANGNLKMVSPNSSENKTKKPLPEGYPPGSAPIPPPDVASPPSPVGQSPVMNNIPGTAGGQPIVNAPPSNPLLPDQTPPPSSSLQLLGNPANRKLNQNQTTNNQPRPNEPPVGVPEQMPQGAQRDMAPKQIEPPIQGASPNVAPPSPTQSTLPMPAVPNRY